MGENKVRPFEPVFQTPAPPNSHWLAGPPSQELQWTAGQKPVILKNKRLTAVYLHLASGLAST